MPERHEVLMNRERRRVSQNPHQSPPRNALHAARSLGGAAYDVCKLSEKADGVPLQLTAEPFVSKPTDLQFALSVAISKHPRVVGLISSLHPLHERAGVPRESDTAKRARPGSPDPQALFEVAIFRRDCCKSGGFGFLM